jgi:hypothetical protein
MENHKLDPDTYPITDWDALMIEKWAPQYKHRLSVSYGNKVIKSRAMLSYSNEDALYYGRNQEQYMARINNDIKINNFISASFDMTYNHRISNNNQVNPVQAAFKYNPIYVSLWSDGTWGPGNNGTNTYARLHAGGFVKGLHEAFFGKGVPHNHSFQELHYYGSLRSFDPFFKDQRLYPTGVLLQAARNPFGKPSQRMYLQPPS